MTPEHVYELLENATPGPWEARATYSNGTPRQDTSRQMRAGDQYLGIMHAPDADLAAAAPDLARLVAGMRYEYTVRVGGSHWLREGDDGKLVLTIDPTRALRHYQQRIMEALAAAAAVKFEQQCRVVRRLVTDEEVVS